MPDPAPGTLAGRLRVLEARLVAADRAMPGVVRVRLMADALAELRSIERAVAEREELRDVPLSHGEGG